MHKQEEGQHPEPRSHLVGLKPQKFHLVLLPLATNFPVQTRATRGDNSLLRRQQVSKAGVRKQWEGLGLETWQTGAQNPALPSTNCTPKQVSPLLASTFCQ